MNTGNKDIRRRDEQVLESLFRQASTRRRAPPGDEKAVRDAVHAEWREMTSRRKTRRRQTVFAVAASLALAVVATALLLRQPAPPVPAESLAALNKQSGDVFIRDNSESASVLLRADRFFAGQELSTIRGSGIALDWNSGESLRVDENSRVAFLSDIEIELLSGRIYIDSNSPKRSSSTGKTPGQLAIRTPAGLVRHLGTQYITGITNTNGVVGVEVMVREGEVQVVAGDGETTAAEGQKLSVTTKGLQTLEAVPTYGESWNWTEQLSPGFDMDGKSMSDFLDWVARETGRRIDYASAETRISADNTSLHGNIDLPPMRALELVLQTGDLLAQSHDGSILVSMKEDF